MKIGNFELNSTDFLPFRRIGNHASGFFKQLSVTVMPAALVTVYTQGTLCT